jgi:hypothetical protein
MRKLMRVPSPAAAVAVLALVVATSGVSYAAGTIGTSDLENNAVTSKKIKNETIKVKDMSQTAVTALRGQTGPQGPAGPTGPAGTVRAYATVLVSATFDAPRTKGFLSVTRPSTGIYCLTLADSIDPATTSAVVGVQWIGSSGDNLSAQWVDNTFACPAGTDFGVRTFTFAAGGNNTLSNAVSFSIIVP